METFTVGGKTICRHFVNQQCRYGNNCWYAHPRVLSRKEGDDSPMALSRTPSPGDVPLRNSWSQERLSPSPDQGEGHFPRRVSLGDEPRVPPAKSSVLRTSAQDFRTWRSSSQEFQSEIPPSRNPSPLAIAPALDLRQHAMVSCELLAKELREIQAIRLKHKKPALPRPPPDFDGKTTNVHRQILLSLMKTRVKVLIAYRKILRAAKEMDEFLRDWKLYDDKVIQQLVVAAAFVSPEDYALLINTLA